MTPLEKEREKNQISMIEIYFFLFYSIVHSNLCLSKSLALRTDFNDMIINNSGIFQLNNKDIYFRN